MVVIYFQSKSLTGLNLSKFSGTLNKIFSYEEACHVQTAKPRANYSKSGKCLDTTLYKRHHSSSLALSYQMYDLGIVTDLSFPKPQFLQLLSGETDGAYITDLVKELNEIMITYH